MGAYKLLLTWSGRIQGSKREGQVQQMDSELQVPLSWLVVHGCDLAGHRSLKEREHP